MNFMKVNLNDSHSSKKKCTPRFSLIMLEDDTEIERRDKLGIVVVFHSKKYAYVSMEG